jgi:hypothetical protein
MTAPLAQGWRDNKGDGEIKAASVGGLFFSSFYFHVHSDAGQW